MPSLWSVCSNHFPCFKKSFNLKVLLKSPEKLQDSSEFPCFLPQLPSEIIFLNVRAKTHRSQETDLGTLVCVFSAFTAFGGHSLQLRVTATLRGTPAPSPLGSPPHSVFPVLAT
jgi:hypothetical protein